MSNVYQNLLSNDIGIPVSKTIITAPPAPIYAIKDPIINQVVDITTTQPKSGRLKDYDVYYYDTDPNSKFFRIQHFPTTLASGKNYFLISGTDLLQPTTRVAIEVLDVNGNNLATEIPDILINGTDRAIVITIYPEDYYGDCIITILGEAMDVPAKWKGNYNIKWQALVLCNPSINNSDDAIFANNPTITYKEIYDNNGSITKLISDKIIYNQGLMYSKIAGTALSPLMQYQLHLMNNINPSTNPTFDTLDNWYTGSIWVDNAYASNNKLYISQSYGLFGVTLGVTQSFAMKANKIYTLTADFIGSESDLGGSVASVMVYSGSTLLTYLYSTASSDVTLTGAFSSSFDTSASIELSGQAFAIQTVWSNVIIQDLISGSFGNGFTKDMEGAYLYISASDLTIYPYSNLYSASFYETYISKVISNNMAIANNSYQAKRVGTSIYDRTTFTNASYTIHYGKTEYVGSDNVQNSYLNVKLRNLSTIVGSLKFIDLYKNPGNSYIGRYPLVAHDMLISGSVFTSSADFINNWTFIESGTYVPPVSTDRTTTIRK